MMMSWRARLCPARAQVDFKAEALERVRRKSGIWMAALPHLNTSGEPMSGIRTLPAGVGLSQGGWCQDAAAAGHVATENRKRPATIRRVLCWEAQRSRVPSMQLQRLREGGGPVVVFWVGKSGVVVGLRCLARSSCVPMQGVLRQSTQSAAQLERLLRSGVK